MVTLYLNFTEQQLQAAQTHGEELTFSVYSNVPPMAVLGDVHTMKLTAITQLSLLSTQLLLLKRSRVTAVQL